MCGNLLSSWTYQRDSKIYQEFLTISTILEFNISRKRKRFQYTRKSEVRTFCVVTKKKLTYANINCCLKFVFSFVKSKNR
jgi:hypothetical protein